MILKLKICFNRHIFDKFKTVVSIQLFKKFQYVNLSDF